MECKFFKRAGYTNPDGTTHYIDECWGTKEREACSCGGTEEKCTFYPEIKEKALNERKKDMILYFEGIYGRREIGRPLCNRDLYQMINKFLEEHKFEHYYTRSWINPNNPKEKWFDVGSHYEFFICVREEGWENGVEGEV